MDFVNSEQEEAKKLLLEEQELLSILPQELQDFLSGKGLSLHANGFLFLRVLKAANEGEPTITFDGREVPVLHALLFFNYICVEEDIMPVPMDIMEDVLEKIYKAKFLAALAEEKKSKPVKKTVFDYLYNFYADYGIYLWFVLMALNVLTLVFSKE